MNKLNKPAKKYYRELKMLLPTKGKYERAFLNNFMAELVEYIEKHTNATFLEITDFFGSPKEIIISYFENVDTEYLMKRLKLSTYIKTVIFCIIFCIIFYCTFESILVYKAYRTAQEGTILYYIDTIE